MGFFGGKTVVVASTVYNMAGDITQRPEYLKSLVAGNVLTSSNFSITETLQSGYLNGPAIKARIYLRWAKSYYGDVGVPYLHLNAHKDWDYAGIESQIPRDAGYSVSIQEVRFGGPDVKWWALQWLLENQPHLSNTDWTSDYDEATSTVTITEADGVTTHNFTATINKAPYFYVLYVLKTDTEVVGSRLWIYEWGSGNTIMDDYSRTEVSLPSDYCLPPIPIRLENEFLSDTYLPNSYELTKRAYKKYTGQRLDDLVADIDDNNASIEDVDHIYIVPAVTLNATDECSLKYLWEFFTNAVTYFTPGGGLGLINNDEAAWLDWRSLVEQYESEWTTYYQGRQVFIVDGVTDPTIEDPAMGSVPIYPAPPDSVIHIAPIPSGEESVDSKFHFVIKWQAARQLVGTGLKSVDKAPGDIWWQIGDTVINPNGAYEGPSSSRIYAHNSTSVVELCWQVDANNWKSIKFWGLKHENRIYKQKAVEIAAADALVMTEESGFLVPIHMTTLNEMSLIDSTQLMITSNYLVFNSYDIVKQKWYETGFFKVIVVVVIIAITVATGGFGAASAGILGTNLAVGTALGFTGVAAVVAGAVANMVAAIIITKLISMGATAVFGDKIGMIVAAIASVVTLQVGSALMSGQSLTAVWGNLMSAQNIIHMTSAVGNGVAGYVQAGAAEWVQKTEDLLDDYAKQTYEIQQKWLEEFGYGTFMFDPMALTDSSDMFFAETFDQFMSRTLMTGIDVAEMTNGMLSNFADLTLSVDL